MTAGIEYKVFHQAVNKDDDLYYTTLVQIPGANLASVQEKKKETAAHQP